MPWFLSSTNTNPAVAKKMGVPLIGCSSHKFNLGVEEWINSDQELVDAIDELSELMKQASYSKAAALLRDFTFQDHGKELCPKQQCVTRWTGTMDMIERYFRIKLQLEKIKSLQAYFLSKEADSILKNASKAFLALRIVTKELQHKGITVAEVRELFDSVLKDYRFKKAFQRTIGAGSNLIRNPAFESGILKLMEDPMAPRLSDREAEACKKLLIAPPVEDEDSDSEDDEPATLERVLEQRVKKRKLLKEQKKSAVAAISSKQLYQDPSKFICATSNCCERLFSEAKYILVPHRSAMSPILFEALLFLKKNKRFWSLELVSKAMTNKPTEAQLQRDDDMFYA